MEIPLIQFFRRPFVNCHCSFFWIDQHSAKSALVVFNQVCLCCKEHKAIKALLVAFSYSFRKQMTANTIIFFEFEQFIMRIIERRSLDNIHNHSIILWVWLQCNHALNAFVAFYLDTTNCITVSNRFSPIKFPVFELLPCW